MKKFAMANGSVQALESHILLQPTVGWIQAIHILDCRPKIMQT